MPDELIQKLRAFQAEYFPANREKFLHLIKEGQKPKILFLGCSDSRIVPDLLTGTGPGDLFVIRNVGAIVPPYDHHDGIHGTTAGIEFAVMMLRVNKIIVCGHSHCGAVDLAYTGTPQQAKNLSIWISLLEEALLPPPKTEEILRRVEQRSIILQLKRLMSYPMIQERVLNHQLTLHGWYYVIEKGEVHILDIQKGSFIPLQM
jgi:carbonic anhydrase